MAIIKKAKNLTINIKGTHTIRAGTLSITSGKITMTATDGDLTLTSNKAINIEGKEGGVVYGTYVPPTEIKHPKILELEFLDA